MSVLVRDRAVRGAAACAVIAGLTVVALPSVARAEGGAGPAPVVSDAALPPVDVTATTEAIVESVDPVGVASDPVEVVSDALDETFATDPEDAPAVAPESGESDAPAIADSGEAPVSAPSDADTTPPTADTTADTASESPDAPRTSDAVAIQVSPTNVNVSIRVASPGDNGSVTQVNVAAATAVGGAVEETMGPVEETMTAAPTPATPHGSSPSGAAGPAVSPAKSTTISSPTTDADTWTWDWDCLSIPTFSTISPTVSAEGTVPRAWTWNWNCGDNSIQYQGATAVQYHPINVNVGIRISSPGNDGPVTQTNIAVAVSAGVAASSGPPPGEPPAAAPALPSVASVSAPDASLPSAADSLAPVELVPVAEEESVLLQGQTTSPAISRALDGGLQGVPFAAPPSTLGDGFARRALTTGVSWPRQATLEGADASGADARASPAASGSRAKPAPRWRQPAPKPLDSASAPSGTSVAPASGGGSSGGGLPIFLALPFIVAVLDLARRVALDRVASPSEHRDRMPDTPG